MSNLAKDIIKGLSPEKQELLLRRLSEKKEVASRMRIPPRQSELDSFPLSFAQQRLWFLDQLEPGGSAYAIPAALRLCGPLSLPALLSSFQQLVQRHESLRTSFVSQQGTPLQVIAPSALLPLPLIDLQALPRAREAQVRQLAEQEARRPFDLASGPLLRLYLVRSGTQEHVLLLCLHHIISDGWSTAVLVRELGEGYRAALRGQPAQVPDLPIQYADYALWQRTWLQGERIRGATGVLAEATGRGAPGAQPPAGSILVLPCRAMWGHGRPCACRPRCTRSWNARAGGGSHVVYDPARQFPGAPPPLHWSV